MSKDSDEAGSSAPPGDADGEWYATPEQIDFSRMHAVFRSLALFDDTFLSMQGMNLAITDQHLTYAEAALLSETFQSERTPSDPAIFVSAWTQMWIFALYELLRTWRQRIRELTEHHKKGTLKDFFAKLGNDPANAAALMRRRQAERVMAHPELVVGMLADRAKLNRVFKMTEQLRMNLAKHEHAHRAVGVPHAPGYGRINYHCGALDYMVQEPSGSFIFVNRRDLADGIRATAVDLNAFGGSSGLKPPRKPRPK